MQILRFEPAELLFFCPITGRQIASENQITPSPATRGIWHTEVENEPDLFCPALKEAWQRWWETRDEEEPLCVTEFFESHEDPDLACFELHYREMGCGPVFCTAWFVIDMSHCGEESD